MNASNDRSQNAPSKVEPFLSGALERIRKMTVVLAMITALAVSLFLGWRNGLGAVLGGAAGYANLVWLHRASSTMIERMMPSADKTQPKFRLVLSFAGRYFFLIALACAIVKGFPSMVYGFVIAMFLPILAATCEGVYEAWVIMKPHKTLDETSLH